MINFDLTYLPSKRNIAGSLSEFGKKASPHKQNVLSRFDKIPERREDKTKVSDLRRTLCANSSTVPEFFSRFKLTLTKLVKCQEGQNRDTIIQK